MAHAPQFGDDVRLADGTTGYVRQVISYWGNVRLWDVVVFDPKHRAEVKLYGHGETERITQIREAKQRKVTESKRLAAQPLAENPPLWNEVNKPTHTKP